MKQYLHIIQKELPSVSESDLFLPIRETNIDSIDVVVIRVALEKYFGLVISDSVWYQFQSLAEALEYFHKNKSQIARQVIDKRTISITDQIEIRMPQMANSALSENWLLKYLGDTHWLLLSKGLEQKSSEFRDDIGNRLYATFVRINYTISSLSHFFENDLLNIKSEIEGFGSNTYLSKFSSQNGKIVISATLMTTFSARENNNNTAITKAVPKERVNYIKQLSNTPSFLNDYRLLKKDLLDEVSSGYGNFQITNEKIFCCEYEPNPFYDINGVGLLYFAAYPIIADKCCINYFKNTEIKFSGEYQTIYRDIFYFANCNPDDTIIFTLNSVEVNATQIKILCSLNRKSDNFLMAKIITVKLKIQ